MNIMKASMLAIVIAVAVPLLSGCCGSSVSELKVRLPRNSLPPEHRFEPIEDGELNWSYWPDVVLTPVFGE